MRTRINWSRVNAWTKHAVAIALGYSGAMGVLDPLTGQVHISSLHAVAMIAVATAVSLLASYAGVGLPGPKERQQ